MVSRPAYCCEAFCSTGASSRQGTHHDAQKLTNTGLLCDSSSERRNVSPLNKPNSKSGARVKGARTSPLAPRSFSPIPNHSRTISPITTKPAPSARRRVRNPAAAARGWCSGPACAAGPSRSAGGAVTATSDDAEVGLMRTYSPTLAHRAVSGQALADSISRSLWVRRLVVEMAGTYTPAVVASDSTDSLLGLVAHPVWAGR